jgi:uncharacterized protein YlxW (UPF0749 family)
MEWLGVDRHRLGTAMVVFGVIGLVLAGIVAGALVAGVAAVRGLDDKIATAESRMGASLTRLTLTIDGIAQSTDNTSATLASARDGVAQTATSLGDVADTAGSLATSLDVTIAGQQPFTGSVTSLRSLEAQTRTVQSEVVALAANLDQNVTGVSQIAQQIRDMRTQFAELAGTFASFADARGTVAFAVGGIALAGLLTVWQAILAGAIAWAGLRLRRHVAAAAPATTAPPTASGDASGEGGGATPA